MFHEKYFVISILWVYNAENIGDIKIKSSEKTYSQ